MFPPITVYGNVVYDDVRTASTFSDYFLSIFSSPLANDDINMEMVMSERVGITECSYSGIVKLLSSLKPEKNQVLMEYRTTL